MEHVLDNPAWNALISGNRNLSCGNDRARYFSKDVSPFAGLIESSPENFQVLYEIIPFDGPVGFITPQQMDIPGKWKVSRFIRTLQMVYDDHPGLPETELELAPLTGEHVPDMLALTKLTNPGPFAAGTIAFGHYYGVFDRDKLVAMAGQRLHIFNYAEISAVCTHPDYAGRGYARQLLLFQVHRIIATGGIPFLHVRYDNERAISVYKKLGFSTRKEIYFYILQKVKQ